MIFLLSQVIAGAGGATLYSIGIAYLDENVNPKLTSKYIGVYYTSAFLGPSIGFVLAGQLLSTYVDIDQVSCSVKAFLRGYNLTFSYQFLTSCCWFIKAQNVILKKTII